jgi:hypothetical protein
MGNASKPTTTWFLFWRSLVVWVLVLLLGYVLRSLGRAPCAGSGPPGCACRDLGYVVAWLVSLLAAYFLSRWVAERSHGADYFEDLNDRLNQNAQLLAVALGMVVTVVLIIAQLGSALGIERAANPSSWSLTAEVLAFALAISVTLIGRSMKPNRWKAFLAVLSTTATLSCFVALAPYFWYQRQQIGVKATVQTALPKTTSAANGQYRGIEDIVMGASRTGNYVLLREGVSALAATEDTSGGNRKCLKQLRKKMQDSYARSLIDDALADTAARPPVAPESVWPRRKL